MRIESNGLVVFDVLVADDTARDVLRAAFGVRRGVMRRRDERVMTVGEQPFQLLRGFTESNLDQSISIIEVIEGIK
jgi:hypothetical protein